MKVNRFVLLLTLIFNFFGPQLTAQDSVTIATRSCWQVRDMRINQYADSLNFWNGKRPLPAYLKDYLMDWRYQDVLRRCLENINEVISHRKAIIDRVVNTNALVAIISSSEESYDKKYDPKSLKEKYGKTAGWYSFPLIRYIDKSWRDLAMERLQEVEKKKVEFEFK